ncbi:hypothetical protein M408DRAFT_332551 [Serendipita vermifera MAFF 305830]|uniref:Uncharacterized protein n=1 Tax=Serendipita vermifera MAFF 305830 TaxID=933852 RepID=A0A0C2X0P2_SERVB|nr:hypothetical protein M408DRAFT_332551 [Serendipita vermifera MAFF 305830]
MDSLDLYHIRQKYYLGSYQPLQNAELPDKLSPDYNPTLLFKARGLVKSNPDGALALLPAEDVSLPAKSVRSLAGYFIAKKAEDDDSKEKALEELRDLCLEIEGEDVEDDVKGIVRSTAAVAFVHEGENEEALETLEAGTSTHNLEGIALTVQLYLSMNRLDLAQKEFEKAKSWAEDDMLLQLIEATVGLASGAGNYSNPHSFYNEQAQNPSLTSSHLVTARGLTHLLRGELPEAQSDFSEALKLNPNEANALAGKSTAEWLTGDVAKSDASFKELQEKDPDYPMVNELSEKSDLFDSLLSNYNVPPLASA